jgi:hypothetical protein
MKVYLSVPRNKQASNNNFPNQYLEQLILLYLTEINFYVCSHRN